MRGADLLWGGFVALVLLYMLLPLALVVLFSFNASALTSLPLTGFTLDWYRELFASRSFWPALWNSLIVGAWVAGLATLFGTLAAFGLARLAPARAGGWLAALALPMMMPALVIAIALLVLFRPVLDLPMGLHTVVLGQLVVVQPFVIAILYARLSAFDWRLVDGARDLGAGPLRAFLDVVLPAIRPSLIGAALIALSLSLDDFILAFFLIGSGNTLPTMIWGLVRTSLDPTINAVATLLLVVSIGSTVIALRISRFRG
jgi:spermidine/putrescine transport system permease protein